MAHQLASQDMRRDQLTFQKITTIAALPVADLSVDGILCSSVLEYVDNPGACLAEFARVLRSGGVLIITVPNRYSLVRRAQVITHRLGPLVQRECFAFLDYSKNEYSPSEFRTVLRSHGFATDKVIPFGSPIPHWLQRQEFGGSLLAFRAIRG
jgi:2-polyprenyl-6-hydroxyphenyl methylase/3-demethylubiquinone-9 3-methyltransferase